MARLSVAVDESFGRAGEFTRSLFGEERWTAAQIEGFVNEQRNVTIASTNTSGQPHAAVVIGGCVDDEIVFTVHPQSVLARNLTANPRIGFSVCDRRHVVMGQGRAERVGNAAQCADLISTLASASVGGTFTPPDWDGDLYRIDIRRIFAS